MEIFRYGEKELQHLKSRDAKLAEAIEKIGPIQRQVNPNLFGCLVHSIIGQQISSKAQQTIWERMSNSLSEITPQTISNASVDELQSFGITFRKADYIKNAAEKIESGQLDIDSLYHKTDEEVRLELSALDGIGIWTTEMLLLFSMQRPDILSYGDLAIQRGLRMLYHHRKIDRKLFNKYQRRYSPYGSVASLYIWEISNGAIEGMKDYAPKTSAKKTKI